MHRPLLFGVLLAGLVATGLATPSAATEPVLRVVVDEQGVAIGGFDPVAYFRESRAVPGSADYEHRWNGATWRFATASARDLFAADPEAYAPQFGGLCAKAISEDRVSYGDPRIWRIVDGRLYFNCSEEAQRSWEADLQANIARGRAVWERRRPMLPPPR